MTLTRAPWRSLEDVRRSDRYVPLTAARWRDIVSGEVRL
jgi:hypothetical protein